MVGINNYEQVIQGNKTYTTLTQLDLALSLFFHTFVAFPLAVPQLFRVPSVHFRLPDDIVVKLTLIGIKIGRYKK